MGLLSGLFKSDEAVRNESRLDPGHRIYAIGDIHGCFDLFAQLVEKIERDSVSRTIAHTQIIILGDFIDRGPDSSGMIQVLRCCEMLGDHVVVLKGNHEALMVEAMRGRPLALKAWLDNGGDATLRSFGVPDDIIERRKPAELLEASHARIPVEIRRWLDQLPLFHRAGDYLFVHAGIVPGKALDQQAPNDLIGIRSGFLKSRADHGFVVVHGHSISGEAEFLHNRIGIDTGAYHTGQLTALALQDDQKWLIDTQS